MKMIKALSVYVGVFLLATSCGTDKTRVSVTGSFDNLQSSEFYLLSPGVWDACDTLRIERGSFEIVKELEHSGLVWLRYPNASQTLLIVEPGAEIKIEGDAKSLRKVRVSGTEANELYTAFRIETDGKSREARLAAGESFIKEHPASMASVAVWYELFRQLRPADSVVRISDLLRLLMKSQPENRVLQQLNARLEVRLKTGTGRKLPPFTVTTLDGDTLKSGDLAGFPVLVCFWGSWNDRSVTTFYRIRSELKQREKQLKVICAAVDVNVERCRQIARRDSLPGYVICDGGGWEGSFTRLFSPQYIPGNLLIDSTGVIIARDIEDSKLAEEIRKRFPLIE